jgi:hypothetical protein
MMSLVNANNDFNANFFALYPLGMPLAVIEITQSDAVF